jgi:hypothetical protein
VGSLWCWREGGKIFEASASLLKVASLFLFLFFFFFLAFWVGFALVWGAGFVGKVPMFLQF